MMAEQVDTCGAVANIAKGLNFKFWYCCMLDGKQAGINSRTSVAQQNTVLQFDRQAVTVT
jgi:hypothetical protein